MVDLFLSAKPPAQTLVINSQYLESTWQRLENHPDISINTTGSPSKQAPPVNENNRQQISAANNEATGENSKNIDALCSFFVRQHAHERMFATNDRVWHAITDHGEDWRRIPRLEWECLLVIAASGSEGILQPDVTAKTGQDKRSVPKRTDSLQEKGYVVKESCTGGGLKTSILRLKKFVGQAATHFQINSIVSGEHEKPLKMIRYDQWFDEIITNVKQNNNLMAFEDLRQKLVCQSSPRPFSLLTTPQNIAGKERETRQLHRCIRRLAAVGLLRRLSARIASSISAVAASSETDIGDYGQGVKPGKRKPKAEFVRCVKLMRDPTESDRLAFNTASKRSGFPSQEGENDDADDDGVDEDDDEDDDDDTVMLEAAGDIASSRIPPQWIPDLHYSQFLFGLIDSKGPEGISSMDLGELISSRFWKRPFDEVMGRLTDRWSSSQPPHLQHLAIIRDTAVRGTITHYTFRTYNNYQDAVNAGDAHWD